MTLAPICYRLRRAASYELANCGLASKLHERARMANRQRIGLRQIRALQPGRTIWDASLPGFGARRQHSQAVSYVLFYRNNRGPPALVHHWQAWRALDARDGRGRRLEDCLARWRTRPDPAAEKHAKRECQDGGGALRPILCRCQSWSALDAPGPKEVEQLAVDLGRIERHIKPLLGRRAVTAVTREDIEAFMHDVASGKTASKTKTAKKRGLARVRGGNGAAVAPWGCWARSLPMRCGRGCDQTTPYMALCGLPTISATGGLATTNTERSAAR